MRLPFSPSTAIRLVLALTVPVGSAVLLSSSDKPALTALDKAYYADPSAVDSIRPGLVVKIVTASVADDGTIKARFKLTDPKGLPLDRDGVTTPGAISTRFVASWIPNNAKQYLAYTVRSGRHQGPPGSGGVYTYTFTASIPATATGTYANDFGIPKVHAR